MFQKLDDAKLLVKANKYEFQVQETTFLGCIITPGQLTIKPEKIKAILEWPQPQNVTDVRSFIGYVNYYRKFIGGYGKITAPLTNLTKKDVGFK